MSPALFMLLLTAPAAPAQTLPDAYALAASGAARPRFVIDENARGAWFRKVAGPADGARGIEAWGVLPEPRFDPAREHEAAPGEERYKSGPLDRPDVYVGFGAEGAEVDCGLIWDHRYDAAGKDTGRFAYRVYWRTSKGGWNNPEPGAADDLYLEPGDRFALTLTIEGGGGARLAVRRAGAGGSSRSYAFAVPGLTRPDGTPKPASFKRVHSIDQFRLDNGRRKGNEGRPALATRTTMTGGRWEGAHLLYEGGGRRALSGALATVVRGPDAAGRYGAVFPAAGVGEGGAEEMSVFPPRP